MRLRFKGLSTIFKRLILPSMHEVVVARRYSLRSYHSSAIITQGEVLASYRAGIDGMATVYIVKTPEEILYVIDEPKPSDWVKKIYPLVMDHIAFTAPPLERYENPEDYVRNLVMSAVEELGVSNILKSDVKILMYYVLRDVVGYGYADVPIRDPNVEEVGFVGTGSPIQVVHRDVADQLWLNTNIVIESEDEAARYVQRLAQRCGRYISTAFPMLETPSPEKHRFALNLSDISGKGSGFVIRKFPENPYPITKLIEFNTLTPLMAAYLWFLLEHNGFIMIIGRMASGKTTMLNVLLSTVRPDAHICTIEDVPELRLPHPGWDPLYTRRGYTIGSSLDIDLFDLAKFALRRRCQVVSIGEVRGDEIQVLIQAAATGHSSACTFHAGSINEMVSRMTSPPLDVGPSYIKIITSVMLMQRTKVRGNVARRVRYVWEVLPEKPNPTPYDARLEVVSPRFKDEIWFRTVFEWNPRTDTFTPTSAVELIRRSYRLRHIALMAGYDLSEVAEELERRANFLVKLTKEKVFDWSELFKRMKRFYMHS